MTFNQWLKKHKQLDASALQRALEVLPIETLDKWAFGVNDGDVIKLHPSCISLVYGLDVRGAIEDMHQEIAIGPEKTEQEWARNFKFASPVEVRLNFFWRNQRAGDGEYQLQLTDGHHRQLAASILGIKLPAKIDIKANPITALLFADESSADFLDEIRGCLQGSKPSKDMQLYVNRATF